MKRLLEKLRIRNSLMRPLEQLVYDSVISQLSPEAAEIARAQVKCFFDKQRLLSNREVIHYIHRDRLPPDTRTFPDLRDDVRLGTVKIAIAGVPAPISASIHVCRGFLGFLLFDKPPPLASADELSVKSVKVHSDPMISQTSVNARGDKVDLPEWVVEWGKTCPVDSATPPLLPRERQRRLVEIRGTLPPDYLELTSGCEGFVSGSISVFGLADVYEVPLEYGTFAAIGEVRDTGMIGVNVESTDGVIYFLPYSGEAAVFVGPSIQKALRDFYAP